MLEIGEGRVQVVSDAENALQERQPAGKVKGTENEHGNMCIFCCVTLVSRRYVRCNILNHCCWQRACLCVWEMQILLEKPPPGNLCLLLFPTGPQHAVTSAVGYEQKWDNCRPPWWVMHVR